MVLNEKIEHLISLRRELAQVPDTPATSYSDIDAAYLSRFATRLTHDITTLTLLLQGALPEEGMFDSIDEDISHLMQVYQFESYSGGPTLSKLWRLRISKLLEAIESLFDSYRKEIASKSKPPFQVHASQTGLVWKAADELTALPTSHQAAIGIEMMQVSSTVKDAFEELNELSNTDGFQLDDDDEDDDVIIFEKETKLTDEESKIIAPVSMMLKTSFNILEKLSRKVSSIDSASSTEMEPLSSVSLSIGSTSDDLVCLVVHPLDKQAIISEASILRSSISQLIQFVRNHSVLGKDDQTMKMLQVVEKIFASSFEQITDIIV